MKRFFSLLIAAVFIFGTFFMSNKMVTYYTEPFKLNTTIKEAQYKGKKK